MQIHADTFSLLLHGFGEPHSSQAQGLFAATGSSFRQCGCFGLVTPDQGVEIGSQQVSDLLGNLDVFQVRICLPGDSIN